MTVTYRIKFIKHEKERLDTTVRYFPEEIDDNKAKYLAL